MTRHVPQAPMERTAKDQFIEAMRKEGPLADEYEQWLDRLNHQPDSRLTLIEHKPTSIT